MVGAVFVGSTVMENAGSAATATPSETLMVTSSYTPTAVTDGVPLSRPVLALNDVQLGLPLIEYVSAWPSISLAEGRKRAAEIEAAAREEGIAQRTLYRAKEDLGVVSERAHLHLRRRLDRLGGRRLRGRGRGLVRLLGGAT